MSTTDANAVRIQAKKDAEAAYPERKHFTFDRSNNDNAMSKQSATEYIFATTTARFNAGYQDAINEMSFGKDRRFVEHGKPFCLPADNNYCKGYHQAFTDHRNSIAA